MRLIIAVQNNDQTRVQTLLGGGRVNVNERDSNGCTALYWAARNGYQDFIPLLIKANAKIDQADHDGVTPMLAAAENDHLSVMCMLCAVGADVNKADGKGRTPILAAAENSNMSAIVMLHAVGADVNKADEKGRTPMLVAAEKGGVPTIVMLHAVGVDVNKADETGRTPMLAAAEEGDVPTIVMLHAVGADVNKSDKKGRTPVYIAAQKNKANAIKKLYLLHANVHTSSFGQTPMDVAAQNNCVEAMAALKAAGAIELRVTEMASIWAKRQQAEFLQGVRDAVGGSLSVILHPFQTVKDIQNAAISPIATLKRVISVAWNSPMRVFALSSTIGVEAMAALKAAGSIELRVTEMASIWAKRQQAEFLQGVRDAVDGSLSVILHPFQTVKDIQNAAISPIATLKRVISVAWNSPMRVFALSSTIGIVGRFFIRSVVQSRLEEKNPYSTVINDIAEPENQADETNRTSDFISHARENTTPVGVQRTRKIIPPPPATTEETASRESFVLREPAVVQIKERLKETLKSAKREIARLSIKASETAETVQSMRILLENMRLALSSKNALVAEVIVNLKDVMNIIHSSSFQNNTVISDDVEQSQREKAESMELVLVLSKSILASILVDSDNAFKQKSTTSAREKLPLPSLSSTPTTTQRSLSSRVSRDSSLSDNLSSTTLAPPLPSPPLSLTQPPTTTIQRSLSSRVSRDSSLSNNPSTTPAPPLPSPLSLTQPPTTTIQRSRTGGRMDEDSELQPEILTPLSTPLLLSRDSSLSGNPSSTTLAPPLPSPPLSSTLPPPTIRSNLPQLTY